MWVILLWAIWGSYEDDLSANSWAGSAEGHPQPPEIMSYMIPQIARKTDTPIEPFTGFRRSPGVSVGCPHGSSVGGPLGGSFGGHVGVP